MDSLTGSNEHVAALYADMPSLILCREKFDPYVGLAQAWDSTSELYLTDLVVSNNGIIVEDLSMSIVVSADITLPDPIPLFWDVNTAYIASFSPFRRIQPSQEQLDLMREITAMFLQAPSSATRPPDRDFVVLFIPTIPLDELEEWVSTNIGTVPLVSAFDQNKEPVGIIRDTSRYSEPRLFRRWCPPDTNETKELHVECQSLPRRRNFLQPRVGLVGDGESGDVEAGPGKIYLIPVAGCTLDNLPAEKAMIGRLISAIMDRMMAFMVAEKLRQSVLADVNMQDLAHILTAITAPVAQAGTDYQLYEFFGDSVLKFSVSCQLFFRQPNWQEGHLSINRDMIVNNRRLARSALDNNLDHYILNDRFTPRRWKPPLISTSVVATPGERTLSMKVLADVVEALIGAAYLEGGLRKAQACLHRLLPEIDIEFDTRTDRGRVTDFVDTYRLGLIIGYQFKDASLLTEALTHPSCEHDQLTQSYQRLEFLGDAVLDMIVVTVLAAHPAKLSQGRMTMIKHALVNANLLAFFCMRLFVPDDTSPYHKDHIFAHLRFNGPSISIARAACLERYESMHAEINEALETWPCCPWFLLSRLHADKFMSDIVESVLGAIFLDGGLDACAGFLEKLGFLPYLRRILAKNVHVVHPRNEAQELVKFQGTLVFRPKRVEARGAPATYESLAILHDKALASVEGCGSSEEADIQVAHMVIDSIKAALADLED